jgi:ubiquinone/menaquinone biosynthesis C-methylase UbiE
MLIGPASVVKSSKTRRKTMNHFHSIAGRLWSRTSLVSTLPALHEWPAYIFDQIMSWGYQPLNQRIIQQYAQPRGWLGRLVGAVMNCEHRPVTEWTAALLAVQPHDHVLDVGCGAGMAIQLFATLAQRGFVAGIDYSPTMVKVASQRNVAAVKAGQVAIREGNVAQLSYASETFDKVCAIETFYFWPNPLSGLREIWRVLKPNGRVGIVMEYSKESTIPEKTAAIIAQVGVPYYSGGDLMELLQLAGFEQVRYITIPGNGHGWLYAEGVK